MIMIYAFYYFSLTSYAFLMTILHPLMILMASDVGHVIWILNVACFLSLEIRVNDPVSVRNAS